MESLHFLPAQTDDLAVIHNWPPYPQEFKDLDYALRKQGWIDEFNHRPHVNFYIAKQVQQILGFSLLAKTAETEAEFRIALHPEHLGKGIGRAITLRTLVEGFTRLNLSRIYLVVRISNERAIQLYQSLGFTIHEQCLQSINNKSVALWMMDIDASHYHESHYIQSFAQTIR